MKRIVGFVAKGGFVAFGLSAIIFAMVFLAFLSLLAVIYGADNLPKTVSKARAVSLVSEFAEYSLPGRNSITYAKSFREQEYRSYCIAAKLTPEQANQLTEQNPTKHTTRHVEKGCTKYLNRFNPEALKAFEILESRGNESGGNISAIYVDDVNGLAIFELYLVY